MLLVSINASWRTRFLARAVAGFCACLSSSFGAATATDGQHHLAFGCAMTGKTSWNRAPFLPSDNAESLPS